MDSQMMDIRGKELATHMLPDNPIMDIRGKELATHVLPDSRIMDISGRRLAKHVLHLHNQTCAPRQSDHGYEGKEIGKTCAPPSQSDLCSQTVRSWI